MTHPNLIERLDRRIAAVRVCYDGAERQLDQVARQAISTLTAEVEELRAEVARLRNIMNEDGLHDPELAEMAGKPIGVIEASVKATKGEGDKP